MIQWLHRWWIKRGTAMLFVYGPWVIIAIVAIKWLVVLN